MSWRLSGHVAHRVRVAPDAGGEGLSLPWPGIRSQRGFSLVELMVVIVIIGLLSGVVTISVRSYLIRSKQNVARLEISKICSALETFYTTYDRYPSSQEGLTVLAEGSDEFPDGILTFVPKDPWDQPYEYVSPGRIGPYEVICYGADHREGGSGADRDLTSAELAAE